MAQRSPTASSTMAMEQAMPSKLLARIVFPSCRMAIAASIATALESLKCLAAGCRYNFNY